MGGITPPSSVQAQSIGVFLARPWTRLPHQNIFLRQEVLTLTRRGQHPTRADSDLQTITSTVLDELPEQAGLLSVTRIKGWTRSAEMAAQPLKGSGGVETLPI